MRPPLNAGENRAGWTRLDLPQHASMRPPLNAGENYLGQARSSAACQCFNEAPAERGGKPGGN